MHCGAATEVPGMSATFFCPFCRKRNRSDVGHCPHCSNSLEHWREQTYEERSLLTLHHPVREYRMMAIQILGQRRYGRAVSVFEEMVSAGRSRSSAITRLRLCEKPVTTWPEQSRKEMYDEITGKAPSDAYPP